MDDPRLAANLLEGEGLRPAGRRGALVAVTGTFLVGAAVALFVLTAPFRATRPDVSPAVPVESVILASAGEACLCVFDIDRTLTGKQGWAPQCPKDGLVEGVHDAAYAQGTLLLSELALNIGKSGCANCYKGIVTAGFASGDGSAERAKLLALLGGEGATKSTEWQNINFVASTPVTSSLVVAAVDGKKQESVASMLKWWRTSAEVPIKEENVYFFDDVGENVQAFQGTGINARQVSCAQPRGPKENVPGAYDGKVGGCGGTPAEVTLKKGVHTCAER